MQTFSFAHLSDDDLVSELIASCLDVRRGTARVVAFLAEVEERDIHLAAASPSMFHFCIHHLGMSPGRAYRHIAGARLLRRFPFLLEMLERGEVFLSTLAHLASFLTEHNVHQLLAETHGKNRNQIDVVLGRWFGIEKFSHRAGEHLIYIDDELDALIAWARDHFRNAIPSGNPTELTKRVFAELKTRVEKEQRQALAQMPKPSATPTKKVPRRVHDYVQARDGGQCRYVDPKTGMRCPAKAFIQKDHVKGQADGGGHEHENLRCACRAHNLWFAKLRYGKAYIEKRIRLRQQKRATEKKPDDDDD